MPYSNLMRTALLCPLLCILLAAANGAFDLMDIWLAIAALPATSAGKTPYARAENYRSIVNFGSRAAVRAKPRHV
jgi:hypothetical protein